VHVLTRLRSLAARHPAVYWCVVLALAAVAASSVWHERARLATARDAWGATRAVAVAASDLAPGDPLAVVVVDRPVAMVPPDALDPAGPDLAGPDLAGPDLAGSDLAGLIVVQHVGADEIVTTHDVGDGILSLLPDGWLGLAVRSEPAPLPVAVGDVVAVLSSDTTVTDQAIVIDVDTDGSTAVITIGVPPEVAGAVAEASRLQLLTLALRRPGPIP